VLANLTPFAFSRYGYNKPWYDDARNYVTEDLTNDKVWPQVTGYYLSDKKLDSRYKLKTDTTNELAKGAVERFNYFLDEAGLYEDLPYKSVSFEIEDESFVQPDDLTTLSQEGYAISYNENDDSYTISAETAFGAMYGVQSLWQDPSIVSVKDRPAYKHRGYLFDTCRHFMGIKYVYRTLAGMEMNKLNILHWHLTDDTSLSIETDMFRNFKDVVHYCPDCYYTKVEIAEIIEYARVRGISIMPEIETPGHVQAMTHAMHDITQECFNPGTTESWDGPLDISNEYVYEWLDKFLREIQSIFPASRKIHLGNDEINYECWESNNDTKAWMAEKNMTNYEEYTSYFLNRLLNLAKNIKREDGTRQWDRVGVWEDQFVDENAPLPDDREISAFVWLGFNDEKFNRYLDAGFEVIRNDCWYLDYISYGETEWEKYHKCKLYQSTGGEISLWAEYVDASNTESRLWPRGSAGAERFWSGDNLADEGFYRAKSRLMNFRCHMVSRGFKAEPLGPGGYCPLGEIHKFDHVDVTGLYGGSVEPEPVTSEPSSGISVGFSAILMVFACFK